MAVVQVRLLFYTHAMEHMVAAACSLPWPQPQKTRNTNQAACTAVRESREESCVVDQQSRQSTSLASDQDSRRTHT